MTYKKNFFCILYIDDTTLQQNIIMKKVTALPLLLLTVLTSSMAAQIIDNRLLTTITTMNQDSGNNHHDTDIYFDIKVSTPPTPIIYSQNIDDTNNHYDALIVQSATRHGVDPALVKAIIHTESSFNPRAVSPAGAQGLMQLMPSTAQTMGVNDTFDPAQNIEGGVKYLAWLGQRFSNQDHVIAAYNAGHVHVRRHDGIPPFAETRNYVRKVNSRYQTLYVNDNNLKRSNHQLAMNADTQIKALSRQIITNTPPKTPILSKMTDKIDISSSYLFN